MCIIIPIVISLADDCYYKYTLYYTDMQVIQLHWDLQYYDMNTCQQHTRTLPIQATQNLNESTLKCLCAIHPKVYYYTIIIDCSTIIAHLRIPFTKLPGV